MVAGAGVRAGVTEDRLFDPGSSVPGAVWGLDVSTRRVALAVQAEAVAVAGQRVSTLEGVTAMGVM